MVSIFPAHKGGVRGVAVEGLNQLVITAGADSIVRFWKFKTKEMLDSVTVESQIASLKLHRERLVWISIHVSS